MHTRAKAPAAHRVEVRANACKSRGARAIMSRGRGRGAVGVRGKAMSVGDKANEIAAELQDTAKDANEDVETILGLASQPAQTKETPEQDDKGGRRSGGSSF